MQNAAFEHLQVDNFTVFDRFEIDLVPGLNILIGENGTGKTHLLKILYALCLMAGDGGDHLRPTQLVIQELFSNAAGPTELIRRAGQGLRSPRFILSGPGTAGLSFEFTKNPSATGVLGKGSISGLSGPLRDATFIPAKEWLAHAPGFLSLYEKREISFERVYKDILTHANLPRLKSAPDIPLSHLADKLEHVLGGRVEQEGDRYYLSSRGNKLDFALVAEGHRKIALLWLLLQNGSLEPGTILLWDEPEANLNPRLIKLVVEVLLTLARNGVQTFIATHSYFVLKEIDLQAHTEDGIAYHVLLKPQDEEKGVERKTFTSLVNVEPNTISDVFADIYDRDISRALNKNVTR